MGIPVPADSPRNMPSTMPNSTAPEIRLPNGAPGDDETYSANDNIRRFEAPSRGLSPAQQALFHPKTRCFV